MEGHGSGLAHCAEQHERATDRAEPFGGQARHRADVALTREMHGDDHAQHQQQVGNAADPEHLERRAGFLHVADEQHRAHADKQTFPEDQHDTQIVGE